MPIEPRLQCPAGGMPQYQVKGKIAVDFQAQTGKALSIWGDAGWGGLVREGKYHDNFYSDALVKACVAMMHTWNPEPAPTWVTCVPSLRHPDLVPDVAKRLAEALNLPFQMVLAKTDHRPEQKTMANSTQQARNIDGSLAVIVPKLPEGAVLLVDEKRMQSLLGRGFLLSQVVEHWQTRAIWVLSRADAAYPRRIKTRLREGAPAVLYGCGDIKLLETGGLAVVGSRHVDQAAMRGALEAGGKVSGVLADRLEKTAMNREHHNLLIDGQLVLISPYDPSAGWFLSMCDHLEFLQKVSKPCVRRELYPGLNLNLLMLLMRFLIPQIRIWKQGVLQKSWKKNQRLNRAWPCLKIFRISSSIDSCPSWDGRKNTRKG